MILLDGEVEFRVGEQIFSLTAGGQSLIPRGCADFLDRQRKPAVF